MALNTHGVHPSSNGLAERFVQTLKKALRRTKDIGRTFQHRLAGFILAYCTTPHTTTNVAPCELLMNRKIRTRLDLLYPDVESRVAKNVVQQKAMHDVHAKAREFLVGQQVMLRNLCDVGPWSGGGKTRTTLLCCANYRWRSVETSCRPDWRSG